MCARETTNCEQLACVRVYVYVVFSGRAGGGGKRLLVAKARGGSNGEARTVAEAVSLNCGERDLVY